VLYFGDTKASPVATYDGNQIARLDLMDGPQNGDRSRGVFSHNSQ